jgi:hypothetical protein
MFQPPLVAIRSDLPENLLPTSRALTLIAHRSEHIEKSYNVLEIIYVGIGTGASISSSTFRATTTLADFLIDLPVQRREPAHWVVAFYM